MIAISISDEIKSLQNKQFDNNSFDESIKLYKNLISSGITKPRGYCLSSIADYTTYIYHSNNIFQNK